MMTERSGERRSGYKDGVSIFSTDRELRPDFGQDLLSLLSCFDLLCTVEKIIGCTHIFSDMVNGQSQRVQPDRLPLPASFRGRYRKLKERGYFQHMRRFARECVRQI